MSTKISARRAYRMRGFSMIEALVALVVLGVGMLGMAGLYVTTLRSSGSAVSRLQAVNVAGDLADRIRANRRAGASYAGAPANNNCIGSTADCTPAQMAAYDLFVWQQQIDQALPGNNPSGSVAFTAGDPNTYAITVQWSEPGEANALTYTLRMQMRDRL